MSGDIIKGGKSPAVSSSVEVAAFLRQAALVPVARTGRRGRLLFAMDATASRQPTWDRAQAIQADMFASTDALGGLDIQLVYFRGFGECQASGWFAEGRKLGAAMASISCAPGQTQIGKVVRHAIKAAGEQKLNAVVFVGDAMEESADELVSEAGKLGMLGVPLFVFHEGGEEHAAACFRAMAKATSGAYCSFDASSPGVLRDLLSAVAIYAAGGRAALDDFSRRSGTAVQKLIEQVSGKERPSK